MTGGSGGLPTTQEWQGFSLLTTWSELRTQTCGYFTGEGRGGKERGGGGGRGGERKCLAVMLGPML